VCTVVHAYSPSAYRTLRDSGCIVAPHENTLLNKTGFVKTPVNAKDFKLTEWIVERLTEHVAKMVNDELKLRWVLKIDAMKIRSQMTLRKNVVVGHNHQEMEGNALAEYILSFQLAAIGKKFELIILSVPVTSMKAKFFRNCFLSVCQQLQSIQIHPLLIVTDNAVENRQLFHKLSVDEEFKAPENIPNTCQFYVTSRRTEGRQLSYWLPDVVHAMKNVRNHTVGTRTRPRQPFVVKGLGVVDPSLFRTLMKDDEKERLRLVPGYTERVVMPSPIQRQKVLPAVKLFDIAAQAALTFYAHKTPYRYKNWESTKEYMRLCREWFRIVQGVASPNSEDFDVSV